MSCPDFYAIDFGTSNSLLNATLNGQSQSLSLDASNSDASILRSLMFFTKQGEVYFGQSAIEHYTHHEGEGRFIRSIKKYLPYESFKGTQINTKVYGLEELVSRFLKELKHRADTTLDRPIDRVILGRPAKFSKDEKLDRLAQDRLARAAEKAGFKEIEFFAEPLAAAYSYRQQIHSEKIILVVDLGGGTSDFTVMRLHPSQSSPEDVLSLGGISVAGDVLDGQLMSEKVGHHFGTQVSYRFPMSNNRLTMPSSLKGHLSSPADITLMSRSSIMGFLREVERCQLSTEDEQRMEQLNELISENLGFALYHEVEKAKINLCLNNQYEFVFHQGDIEVTEPLVYEDFVLAANSKIDQIFSTLQEVLAQAQVKPEQVDAICCTGGTSKVPEVKLRLENLFGAYKIQSFANFHSVIQGLSQRGLELWS